MNILFYMNSLRNGGAERVATNLSGQLACDGNEVAVVTSFASPDEYPVNDKVCRLTIDSHRQNRSFFYKNIVWTAKLRKIIKKTKPDVVISFMAEPNFRSLIACAGLKCKNVISIRNDPDKEYPNAVYRFLAKHLFKSADGVVFQTKDARDWFPKAISDKSEIILNQVDEAFYDFTPSVERHGIVTTGRLVPQKNHKLLIEAFDMIRDRTSENLTIYGEGSLRNELCKMIDDMGLSHRVTLAGNSKNVPLVVGNARLFVLSSDFEGMPNSLMEAMALGTPCISTDCPCGGPEMLSEDGKACVLVPVGNKEQLAEKMLELLADDKKSADLSQKERVRAKEFNPKNVYGSWKDYIIKVVNE